MQRPFFTKILVLVLLTVVGSAPSIALPQFTLYSGNRCVNCHVNQQGAGLRNELGWYSMNETSLISPEAIGLGGMYQALPSSNMAWDERVTYGFDVRFQTARSIDSGSTRKYFPMQVAAHAAVSIVDGVMWEGTYNAGPTRYAGQTSYSTSVLVQPSVAWPQLRVGHFQPSIGIRYDDHSMLIRQIADNTAYANPLIAPNYGEWGAELTYYGLQWLTVGVGAFGSARLSEVRINGTSIVRSSQPLFMGRVVLNDHNMITKATNSYIGASVLAQQDLTMVNVFAGIGIADHVAIMAERMQTSLYQGTTTNTSIGISASVIDGLILEARAEEAVLTSTTPTSYENRVTQLVFGAQIFPLPFIELRPDYRIIETEQDPRMQDQYTAKRWNVQLHLFF